MAEVPRVTPKADRQPMFAAWLELSATSVKAEADEPGQVQPAALQSRASIVAT